MTLKPQTLNPKQTTRKSAQESERVGLESSEPSQTLQPATELVEAGFRVV